MRRLLISGIVFLALTSMVGAAEYKIKIMRLSQDLYKDRASGTIIKTKQCFEISSGESAILEWVDMNDDGHGKLTFENGSTCDVIGVYR
jgi:hypothetical protein